jgi:sulfur dioxygenase
MSDLIFHQLFEQETSTFTYLVGDPLTKEAIIIDPVIEMVDRDLNLLKELGLKLQYILDTHVHADHITGSGFLRNKTGAKIGVSAEYRLDCVDLQLSDGQEIHFGEKIITVIHTPGHTNGCLTFKIGSMIFTGDALLIRSCGRTDFQQGSSDKLFDSIRVKLFKLPDETQVYPGHDYKGFTHTTIGLEKKFNPRLNLTISKDEFRQIMENLNLGEPKKIHEAVPANLVCGLEWNKS